jgi:hypothetical protein
VLSVIETPLRGILILAMVGIVIMDGGVRHGVSLRTSCEQPIENACESDGRCTTYAEALFDLRLYTKTGLLSGQEGACGALRYVTTTDGFVRSTEFFDDAGHLVAASSASDHIDPVCRGEFTYGPPVTCPEETSQYLRGSRLRLVPAGR